MLRKTQNQEETHLDTKFLQWVQGILTKAIHGTRAFLTRSCYGFARDRAGVQGCAVVSYHWGGKPGVYVRCIYCIYVFYKTWIEIAEIDYFRRGVIITKSRQETSNFIKNHEKLVWPPTVGAMVGKKI